MRHIFKVGRITYGIGLIAYGIIQIYFKDFRPSIIPEWPTWMHTSIPVYTLSALMIAAGVCIIGIIPSGPATLKKILLATGSFFLACFLCFHVPWNLFISPNSPIHLGVWAASLKALAFSGGALVLASMIPEIGKDNNVFFLAGRIFFSITIILFGVSHFYYTGYVATLVPSWFGMPVFWTKFAGVALIASGTCIILNIAAKPIALLQALMIFIWLITLHIPRAIKLPTENNGNELASAFDALLFTGVALVIAYRGAAILKKSLASNI